MWSAPGSCVECANGFWNSLWNWFVSELDKMIQVCYTFEIYESLMTGIISEGKAIVV